MNKRRLPSISSRSSKKSKKVDTNEKKINLITSWREWYDRLKNNEDGKRGEFGDFPCHFVVYLYNRVRTGLKGMYNPVLGPSKFLSDLSENEKMEAKQLIFVKLVLNNEHMQPINRKVDAMLFQRTLVPDKQNKGIIIHTRPILLKLKGFLQI